ncbi:MBL fold metallo-hydrolase [Polaribacter sp.]|uniref:MBL fold metallo-hydrolase n=1 Tax=Polaribacter sp. TaxID=1920175 RepID=UPI003F6A8FD2
MKRNILPLLMAIVLLASCKKEIKKNETKIDDSIAYASKNTSSAKITPISHATAVINFKDVTIYLDPTGGAESFSNFKTPDYVLITDIHGDHMNIKTLQSLDLTTTTIIAPKAVVEKIMEINCKEVITINNGETKNLSNFSIEAIPMYNLREKALKFHSKGRGNGYLLTIDGERIYFSGDTEDIPEMRNLKNIDKAFICMNLPYTMTVESAADAVLAFKPKKVYPYHYRGTGGLSDVAKFKNIVNTKNDSIEVIQWNWYPNRKE